MGVFKSQKKILAAADYSLYAAAWRSYCFYTGHSGRSFHLYLILK